MGRGIEDWGFWIGGLEMGWGAAKGMWRVLGQARTGRDSGLEGVAAAGRPAVRSGVAPGGAWCAGMVSIKFASAHSRASSRVGMLTPLVRGGDRPGRTLPRDTGRICDVGAALASDSGPCYVLDAWVIGCAADGAHVRPDRVASVVQEGVCERSNGH